MKKAKSGGTHFVIRKQKLNQNFLLRVVAAHHNQLLLNHLVYCQHKPVLIKMTVGMTTNQKKMIKKEMMTKMMEKLNFLLKLVNIKNLNFFNFLFRKNEQSRN